MPPTASMTDRSLAASRNEECCRNINRDRPERASVPIYPRLPVAYLYIIILLLDKSNIQPYLLEFIPNITIN